MENLAFRHVIADPLDEFLNWDSKFFATICLLFVRPWILTNQFLAERFGNFRRSLTLRWVGVKFTIVKPAAADLCLVLPGMGRISLQSSAKLLDQLSVRIGSAKLAEPVIPLDRESKLRKRYAV